MILYKLISCLAIVANIKTLTRYGYSAIFNESALLTRLLISNKETSDMDDSFNYLKLGMAAGDFNMKSQNLCVIKILILLILYPGPINAVWFSSTNEMYALLLW